MSTTFKQEPHKLLVIPGPIEVTDEVLYANARPPVSHISPEFVPVFGDCIRMLREVLFTTTGQPFIIAGSGTLGWDQAAANLVEPGEPVLVLNSGYFGDSFADCLSVYGAKVDVLQAKFGEAVPIPELEKALTSKKYKLVAFSHVDTSTGVLSDAKAIGETVNRISPDTIVALDGVCSVASEEIQMDAWGIDVVITASQKGLGVPPGLSITCASEKAIKAFESRKSPVAAYYASWAKWLPIMRAYEKGSPAYFATPPVNLVYAFHTSLTQITKEQPTLSERFELHRVASQRLKSAIENLGLHQLPVESKHAANGMTAVWYPDGLGPADLLPRLTSRDIVVAGSIHKDHTNKYFRIGHMGVTAIDAQRGDIDKVINALTDSLAEAKAAKGISK